MTPLKLSTKTDEEVINLLILTTGACAVEYFCMKLDEAYKHKQIARLLRDELRDRLEKRLGKEKR